MILYWVNRIVKVYIDICAWIYVWFFFCFFIAHVIFIDFGYLWIWLGLVVGSTFVPPLVFLCFRILFVFFLSWGVQTDHVHLALLITVFSQQFLLRFGIFNGNSISQYLIVIIRHDFLNLFTNIVQISTNTHVVISIDMLRIFKLRFLELPNFLDNMGWFFYGLNVATWYNHAAIKLNERYHSVVDKKQELAFLPIETIEAKTFVCWFYFDSWLIFLFLVAVIDRILFHGSHPDLSRYINMTVFINIASNTQRSRGFKWFCPKLSSIINRKKGRQFKGKSLSLLWGSAKESLNFKNNDVQITFLF